jgi:hypothetical protein
MNSFVRVRVANATFNNIYAMAGVKPDERDLTLVKRFDLRFNANYFSSNLNILFKNPFIYFK